MTEQAADYAIAIGLNHYPTFGSQGRPLAGAIEDATRFAKWLTDTEVGGGLPKENCKLICSLEDPLGPKREAIDDALKTVWSSAEDRGGGRRLYLYFSGHGQARRRDDVALCLSHWSAKYYRHAALSADAYREMLLRCSPFSELVILLDCCRVRSVDATGGASELGCAAAVTDSGAKRFLLAFASQFQSAAMEAEDVGGAGSEEGPIVRGHFTEALLRALYGGAASGAGGVTVVDLKRYLENNVPRIANEHGHTQRAHVISDFETDTTAVFGLAAAQTNTRIEFTPHRRGPILLEGDRLAVIREDDAATGPWEMALAPGIYRLVELGTGDDAFCRIQGGEGVVDVRF